LGEAGRSDFDTLERTSDAPSLAETPAEAPRDKRCDKLLVLRALVALLRAGLVDEARAVADLVDDV